MREGWSNASVLALGYVGSEAGAEALAAAVRSVRVALPRARLILLWPAGAELPAAVGRMADGRIDYSWPVPEAGKRSRARRANAARAVADLRNASSAGLLVFTESGRSPYLPAYLGCLAGVPRRAGLSAEFGGGLLTNALSPPAANLDESERHLFLVDALGFGRRVETLSVPRVAGREGHRRRFPSASCADEKTGAES